MNKPSTSKNSKTESPKTTTLNTSKSSEPITAKTETPKALTLQPPKLLPLTLAVFLCTALLCLLTYNPYIHSSSTSVNILIDIFHFTLIPLTTALSLFLLYRLLRLTILHRAFRPIHLLSVAVIILSASVFYPVTALLIICIAFYLIAGAIFAASLSFQKKHSLAADPAHFRSSLLSTAIASAVLGFIHLLILAFQIIPTGLPWQISGPLFSDLISVSIIAILPLQLTLTFLVLTKLTPARRANLLSRSNRLIIYLSLLLAATTSIATLAYFEHIITKEYSTPHNCCQHFE